MGVLRLSYCLIIFYSQINQNDPTIFFLFFSLPALVFAVRVWGGGGGVITCIIGVGCVVRVHCRFCFIFISERVLYLIFCNFVILKGEKRGVLVL